MTDINLFHTETIPFQSIDLVPLITVNEPEEALISQLAYGEGTQVITNPRLLDESRRLVANVYEAAGYIVPSERSVEGYIGHNLDPHVSDSTYFARVVDGKVTATVRTIRKEQLEDFPAFKEFGIDPCIVSDVDPDPKHYAEVSALAKAPGIGHRNDVLSVYAAAAKDCVNRGERYWLMSVDIAVVNGLKKLFGTKSFTELGDPEYFMGSMTQPVVVDIYKGLKVLNRRLMPRDIKKLLSVELAGMDEAQLDTRTVRTINKFQHVDKDEVEKPKQKVSTKALANAGLISYCIARAGVIPATSLVHEGVNPFIFLAIDVATVPPYVEGVSRFMSSDNSRKKTFGGAAIAGAAFLAPYGYTAAESTNASDLLMAFGIWGGMLSGLLGARKIIQSRREKQQIKPLASPEQS